MRTLCVILATVLTVKMSFVSPAVAKEEQEKPNIVFIFADDQCFETLGSLNNREIKTPNLDRLARRSTTFTHTYNMGSWSGAVCVASRTMLNTGRFLWYANEIYDKSEEERIAGRFWSEHMKKAGYRTYMTGKWHVRADAAKAFDVVRHVRGGMPNQTPEGYNRPVEGEEDPWDPTDPRFGGFWKGGTHWSEVVGDNGLDFIKQASDRNEPFFMYLAFNAPHDPRQSPREYVSLYPQELINIPSNFLIEYPFKDSIGCGANLRDEKLAPFPRTEFSVRVNRQEYYAIITHMDAQIGRILNAIDDSGKADNTYIFFTADHGLAVGQHGLIGKQNMYDHSVRVPFMVAGPDVPAGATSEQRIYLQDVMPTSLEIAGIERPAHVQFQSLLPILHEGKESEYEAIYGAYLKLQRMVTWGDYKMIMYPELGRARLYNIARDPQEMLDLAVSNAYFPIMKKLFAKFQELQKQMGDELDVAAKFPRLANN